MTSTNSAIGTLQRWPKNHPKKKKSIWTILGVSKNSGKTPKWMVYKGKPYEQMDDLGGKTTPIFGLSDLKPVQKRESNTLKEPLQKNMGSSYLHPQKLTWNLEMMVSNRNLLFQGSIFRFHVCFGWCKYFQLLNVSSSIYPEN